MSIKEELLESQENNIGDPWENVNEDKQKTILQANLRDYLQITFTQSNILRRKNSLDSINQFQPLDLILFKNLLLDTVFLEGILLRWALRTRNHCNKILHVRRVTKSALKKWINSEKYCQKNRKDLIDIIEM